MPGDPVFNRTHEAFTSVFKTYRQHNSHGDLELSKCLKLNCLKLICLNILTGNCNSGL